MRCKSHSGGQAFAVKQALVFVTAIALYLVICIGVIVSISYFLVVFVDDQFHVVHTAVGNCDVIFLLKRLWYLCCFGKCLEISLRNVLLTLVLMFLLKGGLYQIIFLCLLGRGRAGCLSLL